MTVLAVENYRSLRKLVIPLTKINVVTGANGSGKSSLYRALRVLADASRNGAVAALAREGGLPSTLWAGPDKAEGTGYVEPTGPRGLARVALRLGFATTDFGYAIDLGLPINAGVPGSLFALDPEIKRETIWSGQVLRPTTALIERHNTAVTIRVGKKWSDKPYPIRPFDSMLSEFADPENAPELFRVRERMRSWRFYDHFRTDAAAPARGSHIGTRTPVLGHDGADLAAALQTIREIGDGQALAETIDEAFPGSRVQVVSNNGRFDLELRQPGLSRPLGAPELSDGTLRYLLLAAALLTPRPPELLVLNEPETSLHPELLPSLGALIAAAARHSQIIVVSHSEDLIAAIGRAASSDRTDVTTVGLVKDHGETLVRGQGLLDGPPWYWPKR